MHFLTSNEPFPRIRKGFRMKILDKQKAQGKDFDKRFKGFKGTFKKAIFGSYNRKLNKYV